MIRLGGLVSAFILLCGCSPLLQQVGTLLEPSQKKPFGTLKQQLTPSALSGLQGPIMYFALESKKTEAGALLIYDDNHSRVWSTNDGISLRMEHGVLAETRGLGNDLIHSDVAEATLAIRHGHKEALVLKQYLNAEDTLQTRSYLCRYQSGRFEPLVTLAGRFMAKRVQEECVTSDARVQNYYWVSAQGQIVKSRQWVGPFNNYLDTELAKDL